MSLWTDTFAPERPLGFLPSALWWLFGNAEDGPYARFGGAGYGVDDRFLEIDWKAAAKWWLRNPLHNVFFHLIDIPFDRARVVHGVPNNQSAPFWNARGGLLIAINGGPFVSYRGSLFDAYAGWRPFNRRGGGQHGVLGFALRRRIQ